MQNESKTMKRMWLSIMILGICIKLAGWILLNPTGERAPLIADIFMIGGVVFGYGLGRSHGERD